MMKSGRAVRMCIILTTGCLLSPFFYFSDSVADTIILKNGKQLKGLVVERHSDRVIFSTEKGEIPILLSGIKDIDYSDPEQNLMEIGKSYESQNKFGEALAYYEKALELNPDFDEARVASVGVRNKFWAMTTQGPTGEMEKQQALYDSWRSDKPFSEVVSAQSKRQSQLLNERLGLVLEKKGDWVRVLSMVSNREAVLVGLKKNDRLVSLDGSSLRYMGTEAVMQKLLVPRYTAFTMEFERDVYMDKVKKTDKDLGFKLSLKYQGVMVDSVKSNSAAFESGVRNDDLLVGVNGLATRYMPLKDVFSTMRSGNKDAIVLTVRRLASMTRK